MKAHEESGLPLIIGFVSDLMFATRIENTARHLGFQVKWIEAMETLGEADPRTESPGEQLHGRNGRLFQIITRSQPALLIFDLSDKAVPWQKWIPSLKTAAATRQIPILCYGPHVNAELIKEAERLGADAAFPRSRFTANLPALIKQYARILDQAGIEAACKRPLSPLAQQGINLFNQGEYYACHDALEMAWRQDNTLGRNLYRGILQVGIALYQIQKGNFRGALKMLLRARQWLTPLPATCRGVRVDLLRDNLSLIETAVQELGPDHMDQFDWTLFRPIESATG